MRIIMRPNKNKPEVEFESCVVSDAPTAMRVLRQYLDAVKAQWPELGDLAIQPKPVVTPRGKKP